MSSLPAAHRRASSREAKQKMWWQKMPQIASTEPMSASGGSTITMETTAPGGSTYSAPCGLTVSLTLSPLTGDFDSTVAI